MSRDPKQPVVPPQAWSWMFAVNAEHFIFEQHKFKVQICSKGTIMFFKATFAEQSRRLDDLLQYENQADQQLLQEKWEKDAQKSFLADMEAIGQGLSEPEVQALVQYLLDHSYDIRIEGAWTQGFIAATAEGLFEKMRSEQAENELDAQPVPTNEDKAPSRILIPGNRTVTQHRREGDEGISREQMAEIVPEKLDKATMKRLKLEAGRSRRENMTDKAEQATDRGERPRI
ncbi:MAG TPA: hypothetical protein VOA88_10925 [Candidatus Dormibacteraeota bacterium]|nr:hypothetical protein [Candidatus Dormibacteraeota bacterium]